MRKILRRGEFIQTPVPGECRRKVEVKVLGPSDSIRTRDWDPDASHIVVQFLILEEPESDDGHFDDELGSIQVRLSDLAVLLADASGDSDRA
jgi:hypothetical protein